MTENGKVYAQDKQNDAYFILNTKKCKVLVYNCMACNKKTI